MKQKSSGLTWLLRTVLLSLIGISLLVFLVTATLSLLFGHSMWSWVNVLRFIIGGGIAFILGCYGFMIKSILKRQKK